MRRNDDAPVTGAYAKEACSPLARAGPGTRATGVYAFFTARRRLYAPI